jgi:AcrR family transcriptional regulator
VVRTSESRPTYHHGDLARALREEALRLIQEAGPDAVSLRELARRIGVNHAAVYRHYEDKLALLAAVAEDGWTKLVETMRASLAEEAAKSALPTDRLVRLLTSYVRFALAHPAHYRVMMGPRLNETGRFPSLEDPIEKGVTLLLTEIKAARAGGNLTEDRARDWALRVWMFAHGYVTLVLGRRVQVKPSRWEEYFQTLLLPMLGGR